MEPPKTKTEAECDCGEIAEWSSYTQNKENDYEEIYFYLFTRRESRRLRRA